jgi:hypothetical protein
VVRLLQDAADGTALRGAIALAEPLAAQFGSTLADALALARERLEVVEAQERAAAKVQQLAELDEHFEVGQMEDTGAGSSGAGAEVPAAAMINDDVPDDYICPITAELMQDPVSTVDGHIYERAAITQWLKDHDTSPKTGEVLEAKMLIPCHVLRGMIRKFEEERAAAAAQEEQNAAPTPVVVGHGGGRGGGRGVAGRSGGRGRS